MSSGLYYLSLWISSSSISGVSVLCFSIIFIIKISVRNSNRVDPDQMPHSVASDLGLHCLPNTLLASPD